MNVAVISPNVEAALRLIDEMDDGECQVLHNVSWDEYEELLNELGDGYAVRIAYTEGELELMSPLYRHEGYKEALTAMVRILGKACQQRVQAAGSLTLKRKSARRGAEPDTCFYLQSAARIRGQRDIDLRYDPPPDLVVEVDVTSKSTSKMGTYARFGVPEFWCYDGKHFRMYELQDGHYVECEASQAFPFVGRNDLIPFLEQSFDESQDEALESFADWVKEKVKDASK
jgi:Uma2 family endonuclease